MDELVSQMPILLAQKEVKEGKKYSQLDIADATGVSQSVISRLMRNENVGGISYFRVLRVARWLGVQPHELILDRHADG